MATMVREVYIWNMPRSMVERKAHAMRLRGAGITHVRVKAGGDDGRLWPEWVDPQATQPYRDEGLTVTPWFYTWPTDGDITVVERAMRVQPFNEYLLNPEQEWRIDFNTNPWNTVQQANEGAAIWLDKMERTMPSVKRLFSGVPSWVGFPYEAWCRGCQGAQPQHYWPKNLLADVYGKDYDEVGYHMLRGGLELDCVPIITASREYNDAATVALAQVAFNEYPMIDGFSFWEAGNAAFQWEAMAKCLALLPEFVEVSTGPENQKVRSYIDQHGTPVTEVWWGGRADRIKGTNIRDIGITVVGGPPVGEYDRSIFDNKWQDWVYRPLTEE